MVLPPFLVKDWCSSKTKGTCSTCSICPLSPPAISLHASCHSTTGIKHVYTTLTTLWKYFHYSLKRAESLKEIQDVLNLPETKVIKTPDTRWLAHKRCIYAVKASYTALVVTLDSNYQNFDAPEALGLYKALSLRDSVTTVLIQLTVFINEHTINRFRKVITHQVSEC